MTGDAPPPEATGACPSCGKPAAPPFRPFCSKRCADVDLHRWLVGGYALPATEEDEAAEEGDGEGDGGAP